MNPLVKSSIMINSFSFLAPPTKNIIQHTTQREKNPVEASKVPRASRRRIDTEVSSEIPRAKASHRRKDVESNRCSRLLLCFFFEFFLFGPIFFNFSSQEASSLAPRHALIYCRVKAVPLPHRHIRDLRGPLRSPQTRSHLSQT